MVIAHRLRPCQAGEVSLLSTNQWTWELTPSDRDLR